MQLPRVCTTCKSDGWSVTVLDTTTLGSPPSQHVSLNPPSRVTSVLPVFTDYKIDPMDMPSLALVEYEHDPLEMAFFKLEQEVAAREATA